MANAPCADSVEAIRSAARLLVRELGFMGGDFAGGDLSPSAVHALIEIEAGGVTARDLGRLLHLEKSSVSRMLRKLVAGGDVVEHFAEDGRVKILALTEAGQRQVAAIHAFVRAQVSEALVRLQPGQERAVLEGLRLYAEALGAPAPPMAAPPAVEIVAGYRTGLIARITQMHALYYAQNVGFGQRFEAVVAGGLAGFCDRLHSPRNAIWVALRGDEIVGAIAIDGEDLGGGSRICAGSSPIRRFRGRGRVVGCLLRRWALSIRLGSRPPICGRSAASRPPVICTRRKGSCWQRSDRGSNGARRCWNKGLCGKGSEGSTFG